MADQIIDIPGIGPVAFPDTMNDADITAAADRLYRESQPPTSLFGSMAKTVGASLTPAAVAASGPLLMRGLNAAANAGQKAMGAQRIVPVVAGYEAAKELAKGNVKGAAETAGAAYAVPKVLKAVADATAPARKGVTRDVAGRFLSMAKPGGLMTRGAAGLSELAGPLAALGIGWDVTEGVDALHQKLLNQPDIPPDVRQAIEKMLSGGGGLDLGLKGRTEDIDLPAEDTTDDEDLINRAVARNLTRKR